MIPGMAKMQKVTGVAISAAADGDNTIVAAQSGKKIRVLSYLVIVGAVGGNVTWKSGANALSGALPIAANDGAAHAVPPVGDGENFLFETNAGEALILNNGAGVDTFGHLTYTLALA